MMNATRTATMRMQAGGQNVASVAAEAPAPDVNAADGVSTARSAEPGNAAALEAEALSVEAGRAKQPALPVNKLGFRWALSLGLAVTVLSAGVVWWNLARAWVKTDNAYVTAHVHTVSVRVAGTVQEVLVEENQTVTQGMVLARLDPSDFEVKRDQAVAQLAQARARIQQAKAQIVQARAQVAQQQARATKARQDLVRAETLSRGPSAPISRQELDQVTAEAEAAEAELQAAKAALGSAAALAAASQAQEQVDRANLRDAELQLSYTQMVSPASGRIGKRNLETGNRIQSGQALLALVQPEVWVVANFKETQVGQIKSGQRARVEFDAFPGRVFQGRVESISPASGAQFALLPPDNATGNFTKIVQRVPVKIVFADPSLLECQGRVVPGMSAVVKVRVHE
jgi:membrane fusion protein, multidrug efflux system